MPLVRIDLRRGKSGDYRKALMDQVYQAMRDTFDVPEDDRFVTLTEHDDESFAIGRHYLDVERTDDLVFIQITANDTRTIEQKKALFARVAERLADSPQVRPQDVFISLVEVAKENWSLGNGVAQYA